MADLPINPADLAEAAHAIKQIAVDVDRLTSRFVDNTVKVRKEIERTAEEGKRVTFKHLDEVDRRYKQFIDEGTVRIHLFGEEWEKTLDRIEKRWKELGREIDRQMTQARGALGTAGSMLGLSGGGGVFNTLKGTMGTLMGQLPMGGLLGLMLFGRMKEAEFASRGFAAARMFNQVGNIGEGVAGRLTGMAMRMYESWMMDPGELAQLTGGFAQFGVSGAAALSKVGIHAKGFGDDVLGISFAMDTLTKSTTGTFAQAIGQAMESSGDDIRKVTQEVVALGLSLRNTGANVGAFIGQLMQATSGLRMQGQSVGDLAKQYSMLQSSFEAKGMKGSHLARSTLAGIQAVAGGIGSMSEGLAAVVGQRIGGRTGRAVSGVDAIIAMQEGQLGQGGAFMGEVVQELGRLAKEVTRGGSPAQQKFALQKIAPSLGVEGSRAVVEINKAMEADMAKGATLQETIAKHQAELNSAFKSREQETSEFEKAMRRMTMQLVKIGSGMLQVVIVGLANIGQTLLDLGTLLNPLPEALGGVSALAKAQAMGRMARTAGAMDAGMSKIWSGIVGSGDVMKGLFDATVMNDFNARAKAKADAEASDRARSAADKEKENKLHTTAMGLAKDRLAGVPRYQTADIGEQTQARVKFQEGYEGALARGADKGQAEYEGTRSAIEFIGGLKVKVENKTTLRVVGTAGEGGLVPTGGG